MSTTWAPVRCAGAGAGFSATPDLSGSILPATLDVLFEPRLLFRNRLRGVRADRLLARRGRRGGGRGHSGCYRSGCGGLSGGAGVDAQNHLTDLHLLADLDLDVDHGAGHRRRHFNRRLVGLQLENRLFFRQDVARFDQDTEHVARCDVFAKLGECEVCRQVEESPPRERAGGGPGGHVPARHAVRARG